jgi:hypothetical protein
MRHIVRTIFLLAACLFAAPALAQSEADFIAAFSGKWQVYDQHMATGKTPCQLDLSNLGTDGKLAVSPNGCAAPLSDARNWTIEGSQLVLYNATPAVVVKLGGNQKRITGSTDAGLPIILERQGGDGTAALLLAASNASGCYYLGYGTKCADKSELGPPDMSAGAKVSVQVNLNAHGEPRSDANTVGTVPMGTCIAVQVCVVASDGPWCRATIGTQTGWLRKLTIRQNRWPVVAFTNSCG